MYHELKKCPFCGGRARLNSHHSEKNDCYFCYAQCRLCYAKGRGVKLFEDPRENGWSEDAVQDAVDAWNARVTAADQEDRSSPSDLM